MKKGLLFTLILTMLASMAACSKANNTEETNTKVTPTVSVSEPTEDKAEEKVEELVEEKQEELIEVGGDQRVVASSVAVVEILDALNVPMVGVPTSSYELPESVADATRIGNPMSPDMEVIASLDPTVVFSVNTLSEDLKKQFEALEIPNQFVDLSSYNGLKASIAEIGTYFGIESKSNEMIANFDAREADLKAKVAGKESPSVLIIFGASGSFMVATENTYVGDLVKHVGATNIMAGVQGAFIPVDMEYLADKNPEYILFMAHANPQESIEAFKKEFEGNEAWQNFDAVLNNKTIALDLGYFGMSANLLAIDAMDKLVDYIYAE